jgi:hypothetical protein
VPEQRPELEGPSDLLLFSAVSSPDRTAVPVTVVDGVATIEAAALLGIQVGDTFHVIVPGAGEAVGNAEVKAVSGGAAVLRLSDDAVADALTTNAVAVPTSVSVPRVLVHVGYDGDGATALRTMLGGSARLGLSQRPDDASVAVSADSSGLGVLDSTGARWRTDAYTDDEPGHREVVRVLDAIAVGNRLLDLPSGDGPSSLGPVVEVDFGLVDGGARTTAPLHGARLQAGTHVYLTLRNTGPTPLFVWVFDIGVSGRSSLITNAAPSGTMIGAAGAEDDTLDVWGADGEALFWPDDVPGRASVGAGGRPEMFVILQADQRSDLSSLASPREGARGVPLSPLDAILDEVRTGRREVPPNAGGGPALRYRIDRIEFVLLPA